MSYTAAADRVFRLYHKYCVAPDTDILFSFLNAVHSLNDRLRKATGEHFFGCHEFITLKALRNVFQHEAELIHEVRIIPADKLPPLTTDLLILCLVPADIILMSIQKLNKKRREKEENIIRSTLKWYGSVVNINPCIFNFCVHAYERLHALGARLDGHEFREFQASYRREEEQGLSHFFTGNIYCHAASVERILEVAFHDLP